jgi:hypothetical protein
VAYKFEASAFTNVGEKLENSEFKTEIDNIVKDSRHVTSVGWRPDTGYDLYDYLTNNTETITVVEIFGPNLANFNMSRYRNINLVNDDIRNFEKFLSQKQRDCIIWQDGPEHLQMEDSIDIIKKFQKSFNSIIIATPNGVFEQDAMYGNEAERHLSSWYKKDYEELDFKVSEIGGMFLIGYWKK